MFDMTKESSSKFATIKNDFSKDIGIFGFTLLMQVFTVVCRWMSFNVLGIQGVAKLFDSRENISLCCQVCCPEKMGGGGGTLPY